MNHDLVNSRISQLPIAMAGIVHAFSANGIRLSIYDDTIDHSREDACLHHNGWQMNG
ncbi:RAxF-45 family protein [Paenibacillus glycinis]|uniref:RAxF-45 family protein n=1 Tax=Paenibacillus glycinis TaxID=2697035 RepID=UPI00191C5437|nr:RAxF-45 family protein [Paenibacillus glycinis]